MQIRNEINGEEAALSALITAAFETAAHADGTEAQIVEALRADEALLLSLVAEAGGVPVGHLGASAAGVNGQGGWAAIAPVSVHPDWQGRGVGTLLMTVALAQLRAGGLHGAVLVGDQGYYGRFGFQPLPELRVAGVPPAYVLALPFRGEARGEITFHPAFGL